jgi:hypothetical protein
MIRNAFAKAPELPREFLDWQVALRRHTAEARDGAPHIGVAPLLLVRRSGVGFGAVAHSVICGLLPRPDRLEAKTAEFRELYEANVEQGARAIYDRGLEYLRGYYRDTADFDPTTVTTLMHQDLPATHALEADPRCALVFHVFDGVDSADLNRTRCMQLNCKAEVLRSGPVYDNVWWHNALFHGAAEESVVVRFRHESAFDTRFGTLEAMHG